MLSSQWSRLNSSLGKAFLSKEGETPAFLQFLHRIRKREEIHLSPTWIHRHREKPTVPLSKSCEIRLPGNPVSLPAMGTPTPRQADPQSRHECGQAAVLLQRRLHEKWDLVLTPDYREPLENTRQNSGGPQAFWNHMPNSVCPCRHTWMSLQTWCSEDSQRAVIYKRLWSRRPMPGILEKPPPLPCEANSKQNKTWPNNSYTRWRKYTGKNQEALIFTCSPISQRERTNPGCLQK